MAQKESNGRRRPFNYGGQAVIEGVMMRGAHSAAVAVRNSEGEIVVHETPLSRRLYRGRIIKTPFLRGVVGLWDALGLGTRALMWAADVAVGDEDDVDFNGPIGWLTIGLSLLLGMGLFFLVPTLGAAGIGNVLGLTPDGTAPIGFAAFLVNLIEGLIQITMLICYIWAIGRIPDVKRLFGYHGAEHKTINAWEAGAELTHGLFADRCLRQRAGVFAAGSAAAAPAGPVPRGADSGAGGHRLRGDPVLGAQFPPAAGAGHGAAQPGAAALDHAPAGAPHAGGGHRRL